MRLELINRRRGRLQGHIRPGLFAGVYSPVGRLPGIVGRLNVGRLHGPELIIYRGMYSPSYILQLDK